MNFNINSPNGKRYNIKAMRCDFHFNNDIISMYEIGKAESLFGGYVVTRIPDYILSSLDHSSQRQAAIKAIGDYLAGWYQL